MMDMIALQALAEGYARAPSPKAWTLRRRRRCPCVRRWRAGLSGAARKMTTCIRRRAWPACAHWRVYQPERGVPFAAFAAQYAGGAIRNYLRDQAAAVRLPARCMSRVRS